MQNDTIHSEPLSVKNSTGNLVSQVRYVSCGNKNIIDELFLPVGII